MGLVGKLLLTASLTGTLAVGAIAWNGSESLQTVKNYAESMKSKVSSLASDVDFLNGTITGKNGQIDKQKGRITELEGTVAQLTAERDALQAEVDRLSVDNVRIPKLEAQIQTLNARISELEGQVSDLQASLASLQADYDNAVAELEKANGEIAKANQESQELKDQVAALEAEAANTYNTAKVDRTNPAYSVEETNTVQFPTLQGMHWSNLHLAVTDEKTMQVMQNIIKTNIVETSTAPSIPGEKRIWLYTKDKPILDYENLDTLMEFLAKNSDVVTAPYSFYIYFSIAGTNNFALGGYNIYLDNTTGKYIVDRLFD